MRAKSPVQFSLSSLSIKTSQPRNLSRLIGTRAGAPAGALCLHVARADLQHRAHTASAKSFSLARHTARGKASGRTHPKRANRRARNVPRGIEHPRNLSRLIGACGAAPGGASCIHVSRTDLPRRGHIAHAKSFAVPCNMPPCLCLGHFIIRRSDFPLTASARAAAWAPPVCTREIFRGWSGHAMPRQQAPHVSTSLAHISKTTAT